MTYGDFIVKLKDWSITATDGSIGGPVWLIPKAGSPFAVVLKRKDDDELHEDVYRPLLVNLGIPPEEF